MSTQSKDYRNSPEASVEACPRCGMERTDWPTEGFNVGKRQYCCQGCADDTGCTCTTTDTPS